MNNRAEAFKKFLEEKNINSFQVNEFENNEFNIDKILLKSEDLFKQQLIYSK